MSKQTNKDEIMVMGAEFAESMTPSAYDHCKTKSDEIRARAAAGESRAAIAKAMGLRYQHVRNVLLKPLKKAA